jgi:transcriptional regulator with XRE-family HTH domain
MQSLPPLLRAARYLLGFKQVDVEKACKLSDRFLISLEGEKRLRTPSGALVIKAYYESNGVEFLQVAKNHWDGVRWKTPHTGDIFSGKAYRAARGLAALSQDELAERAGVGRKSIALLESGNLDSTKPETVEALVTCFRELNIEVTEQTSTYGAGTRWIKPR